MPALKPRPIGILIHGGTGRMGRAVAEAAASDERFVLQGLIDLRPRSHKPLEHPGFVEHIPGVASDSMVVVDFSHPAGIGALVTALSGTGIRLVSGTTGLGSEEKSLLEAYSKESAVFYDTNMSYGISVMKKVLSVVASLWADAADVEIVETHRRGKRDYPSGTAHALARAIAPGARLVSGREGGHTRAERVIHTHSLRVGGVPGDHEVVFATEDEVMRISHRALSREAFARGALRAVRFVVGKGPGMYSMDDLTGG